ncbi:hypothetical protein B0A48_13528 [Cryoendolithus antarcticus]|uniref:Peptidase S8/S53 domain-containing protein n=1 Tax=Cryoendolithus antarcticus TaxID=1507870 RepID=A0A1V8SPD4_9PEZI|nr:hypothetical protein B0A48_13528 [Cryoendolithus antarcticus]
MKMSHIAFILSMLSSLAVGAPTEPIIARQTCEAPYQRNDGAYEGHYIVEFADGYTLDDHFRFLGGAFAVEGTLDEGYYTSMSGNLLAKVRSDCNVTLVEDNTLGESLKTYDPPDDSGSSVKRGSQAEPGWALKYLSADSKPASDDVYDYLDSAGKGVDVYVFDGGITHLDEFKTSDGVDRVVDELDMSDDLSFEDFSNHGTRVAVAIGGATCGIARAATLRSVKVTQNFKPNGAVFAAALEVIVRRHKERAKEPGFRGSVCNFSLDLYSTAAIIKAIKKANTAAMAMVASAGNHGYSTKHFPSSDPHVISVGAMQEDYKPWNARGSIFSSNYGKNEVAFWAPGTGLPLFTNKGAPTTGTAGTSFASGYVAGIFALFYGNEKLNWAEVNVRASWNADEYMDFSGGTDWKGSLNRVANTGYRKGQKQNPKVPYTGAPTSSS